MPKDEEKRRLKGLDEMPLPRRTMRQRYFRAKSNIRSFLTYAPVRGGIWLIVLVAAFLLFAKMQGWPVERWFLELSHKFHAAFWR